MPNGSQQTFRFNAWAWVRWVPLLLQTVMRVTALPNVPCVRPSIRKRYKKNKIPPMIAVVQCCAPLSETRSVTAMVIGTIAIPTTHVSNK